MEQRNVKSVPQTSYQPVVWLLTAQFAQNILFVLHDLNFDYIRITTTTATTIIIAAAAAATTATVR
jgi:hypothetical protein